MNELLDPLILARWQFGLTTLYHFLFVPLTIGMAFLVAILQTAWVRTDNPAYLRLVKLFGKIFRSRAIMELRLYPVVRWCGQSLRAIQKDSTVYRSSLPCLFTDAYAHNPVHVCAVIRKVPSLQRYIGSWFFEAKLTSFDTGWPS